MCVIWGIPYLLIRVAVRDIAPGTVVFLRAVIGVVVLAPFAVRSGAVPAVLRRWRPLLAFTAAEMAGPWFLLTDAERHISSSLSGLMVAAVPLVAVVVGRLAHSDDRPSARQLVGVFVGLAGVVSLVGLDLGEISAGAVGEIAVVVVGYAVAPMVLARTLGDLPVLPVMCTSLGALALGYLPYTVLNLPSGVSGTGWAAIAVLGLVCTALAFVLFGTLIGAIGPARALVITYVNPAVAVLAGVVLLGERFTTGMAVGFPLILAGSVLAAGSSRRRAVDPASGQSSVTSPDAVRNVAETSPLSSASSAHTSSMPSSGCTTELPR